MGIVEQLRSIVVKDALDLSELDECYVHDGKAIKLPFRVNWSRRQKERWRDLYRETLDIHREIAGAADRAEVGDEEAEAELDALEKQADAMADQFDEWWAEVFGVSVEEAHELQMELPTAHWLWIVRTVHERVADFEAGASKKVDEPPTATSEAPAATHPKSSDEPS